MAQIQWSEELAVGVPRLDAEHQALIQRLNDVSAAVENRQGEVEIIRTLGFLSDYADFHFAAEEEHMAQIDYPGLAEQKTAHQEFLDTLKTLKQDFEEEGSTRTLAHAINTFLMNWLTDHIRTVDRRIGVFMANQGKDQAG
jgi:hemerythrin